MDKEIIDISTAAQAEPAGAPEEEALTLKFDKPYLFEGQSYAEIDLSGLERLTARDMSQGEKYLIKNGGYSPTPEMSVDYACFMASRATGKPVEFFTGLPAKEAVKLKNRVGGFFYGEG